MLYADTIAALATPPGIGGVGIIRISGDQALSMGSRLVRPVRRGAWQAYRMRFGHVLADDGSLIDEALAHMEMSHVFGGSRIEKE